MELTPEKVREFCLNRIARYKTPKHIFIVDAFPVAMRAVDFLITFLLVMVISTFSVVLTVRRARI